MTKTFSKSIGNLNKGLKKVIKKLLKLTSKNRELLEGKATSMTKKLKMNKAGKIFLVLMKEFPKK